MAESRQQAITLDYKALQLVQSESAAGYSKQHLIDYPFNLNPRVDNPARILCRAMATLGYLSYFHDGLIIFEKCSNGDFEINPSSSGATTCRDTV
jgi:hypothetical protein